MVDPLKVEVILNLPPPSSLRQLQSLQGKEKFLHRFIPNYTELMLGFNRLLEERFRVRMGHYCQQSLRIFETDFNPYPTTFPTRL
jgi:hypothetical protein